MVKPSLHISDTWALWNPNDHRTIKNGDGCSPKELLDWYGVGSLLWESLKDGTTLKPEIMIVGENPSKNNGRNNKIIKNGEVLIQCFHSNSILDRKLKVAIEQVEFFKGACMTDAFVYAYEDEENGKMIKLKDIKKKYPAEWARIYGEAKEAFANKVNDGRGSLAIVAMGEEAFRYVQEFLFFTDIQPSVKKLEVTITKNNLRIYRICHPSPRNIECRHLFVKQLVAVADDLKNGKVFGNN